MGRCPSWTSGGGTFDAVVANFVLNHVGDPLASATELIRVARPGGWVSVSIWPRPVTELHRLWDDVVEGAGAQRPPTQRSVTPDADFERSPDGLAGLLAKVGLQEIESTTVRFVHCVDPSVWWSGPARGVATIGEIVQAQAPEVAVRMKMHYDRLSSRYLAADGLLHLPTAAVLAHGQVS